MNPSSAILLIALACVPFAYSAVPHISGLMPVSGPKEGGTRITVTGAAFEDSNDLTCKFSRVDPDTEQVTEKTTPADFKSSTEIVCDSPSWDEATCPYCDKETHGSTCKKSCANQYPWDSAEAHANVLRDNGNTHYNAEGNHHLSAGIGGGRGKWPCASCANEYDEHDNPNGQWPIGWKNTLGGAQAATIFTGYHGSPYLRTNSDQTPTDLGPGSFIKIESQFFTIARIETCAAGEVGCWCAGKWSSTQLNINRTAPVPITNYPVGADPATSLNNAMYNYDANKGYWDTAAAPTCMVDGSLPTDATTMLSPTGSAVTFLNDGAWKAGTKITLDQPLYLPGGTPYQKFFSNDVYISSKKPCVDCKCKEGCAVTVTVTNDQRSYSGGGTNGRTWHGSAAKFSLRHVTAQVHQIQFPGLSGYRDSSRMFVPNTGNTRIRVKGRDFQNSPLLRCYFDMPRVMHQAEFIDSETVECLVPQWVSRRSDAGINTDPMLDNKCADAATARAFANDISDNTASARLFDTMCTDSQTTGSASFKLTQGAGSTIDSERSFSHVQVTNNALHRDLSPVVHKRSDGARSYLEGEGSDFRSTCYQLPYPSSLVDAAVQPNHEQHWPCYEAHQDALSPFPFHYTNDVTIKYSPCYEALKAETATGSNYRLTHAAGKGQMPNSTHGLGQKFRIAFTEAGPLVAVNLHLTKMKPSPTNTWCQDPTDCAEASRLPTTLEVCISAGGFKGQGQTLACEWITIQNIKSGSEDFMVYFAKAPYLLGYYTTTEAGFTNGRSFSGEYYLSLKHVSGPETVAWEMSDQSTGPALTGTNGYIFHPDSNTSHTVENNHGFRASFYTCDGCRWKYQSIQTTDSTSFQIGKITGRQNQSDTYLATHPGVRCTSQLTQTMGRSYVNEGHLTAEGLPRVNTAEDPSGVYADECGTPTYREQAAQAIRPTEDVTVTKMRTKMRGAFVAPSATHDDRTAAGDFKSGDGATVSTWITEHGKLGEYVCHTFTGTTQTDDSGWQNEYNGNGASTNAAAFGAAASGSDLLLGCGENNKDCMHCDTDNDGTYSELCFTGALCNKTLPEVYGGCGVSGVCAMSRVVTNAHVLRNHPDGSGPFASSCGEDIDCKNSQVLKVQHSLKINQATTITDKQDVLWEFEHPVKLKKHTTYYVNMAIDESIQRSDSVYWYAGTDATSPATGPNRSPFLGSYTRTNIVVDGQMMFTWVENPANKKFDLELMRCVSSLPSIDSFSTPGAGTGSCRARSSPGAPGATIVVKGKNFFPSANLRVVFLRPDGGMGPHAECTSTKYDFTEMTCVAPSDWNPDDGIDCSVPGNCEGVKMMPTNDGINYGPEYFTPKFYEPYDGCTPGRSPSAGCDAVPTFINRSHHFDDHFVQLMGENLLNFCFSNIYVSTSGNDHNGDGTKSRPFRTLQRAIDAANPQDVIVMMPGLYTGTGNRGLRHMNKRLIVKTVESEGAPGSSCWCTNNVPCTVSQGAATILNPLCVGEKKYSSSTGVSMRDTTVIDCEFAPDGFVINNNKDSASPFSGFVDFSDITTRNCEQLRVYN